MSTPGGKLGCCIPGLTNSSKDSTSPKPGTIRLCAVPLDVEPVAGWLLLSLFSAVFATTCCEDFVSVLVPSTPVSTGDAITGMSTDGTAVGSGALNGLAGLIGLTGLIGFVALVSDFVQLSTVVIQSPHTAEAYGFGQEDVRVWVIEPI